MFAPSGKRGKAIRGFFAVQFHHAFLFPATPEIREKSRNTAKSDTTMVEPTGVENSTDDIMPNAAQITEITAEHMITPRKLLNSLIAASAGNIISAEISSEPTRFIARTIITAVITATSRL